MNPKMKMFVKKTSQPAAGEIPQWFKVPSSSCRHRFSSQQTHGCQQPSVVPLSGDLTEKFFKSKQVSKEYNKIR